MKSATWIHRLATLAAILLTASLAVAGDSGALDVADEPGSDLKGFHAEYKLKYSMFSGTVVLDLQATEKPDEYLYEVTTRAGGVARIAMSGDAIERSRFIYTDGAVKPMHYYLNNGRKNDDSETDIQFDWSKGIALTKYEGQTTERTLEPETLDRLSTDVTAIIELRAGRVPGDYSIMDDDSIKIYGYEFLGEEKIKVPAGEFRTLKYNRQRPGSSRSMLVWFAPDAGYLPVRTEYLKRGKTTITSTATVLNLQP
jgi:hypothetical protein